VISINHKRVQTWKLPFDLKGLKIEHERMFKTQEDDAVIVLNTSDENGTHGEIVFRLSESPHCEDDSRCAAGIGKANIESVFRYDFVISASIDTDPIVIECDEKALCTDERLINKLEIVRVKPRPKPEVSFTVKGVTYPNDTDLKRFLSFSKKLEKHPEKETLDRCKEWFKRGVEEESTEEKDTVNMFIMYWIAFNSLYSLFKPKRLFNWNNVHGKDNEKLIRFLRKDLKIGWAKDVEIRKSDDGKTIHIHKDENSAEIMIDAEKGNATLKISNGKTHVLKVDSKLNIFYVSNSDTKAVKMLLNDYPKDVDVIINKHNKIIDSLCQKNLTNQNGTKNYSDDLKQSMKSTTGNHRKMQHIGLCLWQVRNDIFHGGNTPKEERDFIKDCAYLLKDMFRSAMYSYVVGK
jgi:hypothetical protein